MNKKKNELSSPHVQKKPNGLLFLNKKRGVTSFSYVPKLRYIFQIQKIGHAGTLDPLAEGLLIFLIGKSYTKRASEFSHLGKEYEAVLFLGKSTTTYDAEGAVTASENYIPTKLELEETLRKFQGTVLQIPPMFSAKKVQGKRLYALARNNITIERKPCKVELQTTLKEYAYPYVSLHIACSKGTYVRSLANDIGESLGTKAYLHALTRTKIGPFSLDMATRLEDLQDTEELKKNLHETPRIP